MVTFRRALLSFAALGAFVSPVAAQETSPPASVEVPAGAPAEAPAESAPESPPQSPVAAPAEATTGEPVEAAPPVFQAPIITIVPPVDAPTVEAIPAVWAPVPLDTEGRSAFGLYLSGRYLAGRAASGEHEGDGAQGAAFLAQVEALTPEQPLVREQAFTAALLAGDLDDAARIAPSGEGVSPVISEAGKLVGAVQTFAHGDARASIDMLLANPVGSPHARAAALVQPWIAASAGRWDVALIQPPAGAADLFAQVLRYQRAQLLESRRQTEEADAAYMALATAAGAQAPFRLGYGAFLERHDRRDEAVAVYDAALVASATDAAAAAARERALAARPAPKLPTLREGAAGALLLASELVASDSVEFSAVYTRLSINILPSDGARLRLGAALASARMESAARDALAQVRLTDPQAYAAARMQIAGGLARQDRHEDALAEFRKAADAAPTQPRIAYFLASQLVQLKRNEEALTILNGPLVNTPDQGAEVRFLRGAAYEDLGRVAEAEAELWAALQAQPDEPSFLNYLGYLWVDSGTRVAEGAAMIARAHAAEPDDGNIQDSLGWAQYRQGQYEQAVDNLEQAVAKEPANAEINDHLGDAYWQVGRKREAGFQWTRVLTLDPDAERRAAAEKKLADGLDPSALPGGA